MVHIDTLRDCLNKIVNGEKSGKRQVLVRPASKVIVKFLQAPSWLHSFAHVFALSCAPRRRFLCAR